MKTWNSHQMGNVYSKCFVFRSVFCKNIREIPAKCKIRKMYNRPKESSYTKNEYNLFHQKLDTEYFLLDNFFEKSSIFRENSEKLFWGHIWRLFRERRRLASKINITFSITNAVQNTVSNIFLFNNFFEKSNIFGENGKKFFGDMAIFLGEWWSSYTKNEYNLFYQKFDAKCSHFK